MRVDLKYGPFGGLSESIILWFRVPKRAHNLVQLPYNWGYKGVTIVITSPQFVGVWMVTL